MTDFTKGDPARERRGEERVRPSPLRIRLHRTCEGILLDISDGGALVQLPSAIAPDKRVTLYLEWQGQTLSLDARIVRSTPHQVELPGGVIARHEYRIGVQFLNLSQKTAAVVREIMQSKLP